MQNMSNEYKKITQEIENTISDEKERKIVKKKIEELADMFLTKIEDMTEVLDSKLKELEENGNKLNRKVEKIQKSVNEIQKDIYEEDENDEYEFEIVCPYCNTEFVAEIDEDEFEKNEIKCPECNNVIELDWNEDETGCTGGCSRLPWL